VLLGSLLDVEDVHGGSPITSPTVSSKEDLSSMEIRGP
jgi:hypothetical protein